MSDRPEPSPASRHPFLSLIAARVREFCREPTAIFWVYVFPLILVVALGVAFRNKPVGDFAVAVPSRRPRRASPADAGTRRPFSRLGGHRAGKPGSVADRACGPGHHPGVGRRRRLRLLLRPDPGEQRLGAPRGGRRPAGCRRTPGRHRGAGSSLDRARRPLHRLLDSRLAGHGPVGRRHVGRRLCHRRHAAAETAQAVLGDTHETQPLPGSGDGQPPVVHHPGGAYGAGVCAAVLRRDQPRRLWVAGTADPVGGLPVFGHRAAGRQPRRPSRRFPD